MRAKQINAGDFVSDDYECYPTTAVPKEGYKKIIVLVLDQYFFLMTGQGSGYNDRDLYPGISFVHNQR
jgi:hypothetical protein